MPTLPPQRGFCFFKLTLFEEEDYALYAPGPIHLLARQILTEMLTRRRSLINQAESLL